MAAFREHATIVAAAQIAKITRDTHYWWMKSDPEYAARFNAANEEVTEGLEAEARRRAQFGVEEPVYGKLPGKDTGSGQIGSIHKYSDVLLIFLLKARRPEVYRERIDAQIDHRVSLLELLKPVPSSGVPALPSGGSEEPA